MPYTPTTWVENVTTVGPTNLNHLETGLAGAVLSTDVAYANYTPTWTSTGTAPVIGNAVVIARYVQVGKLVHAYGQITFGSTSTFGTAAYRFALPVTSSANAVTESGSGTARLHDVSANFFGQVATDLISSTTMRLVYGATLFGAYTEVGQLAPWTWAVSDVIGWNLLYEAA